MEIILFEWIQNGVVVTNLENRASIREGGSLGHRL